MRYAYNAYLLPKIADLFVVVEMPEISLQRVDEQRECYKENDDGHCAACRAIMFALKRVTDGNVTLDGET